jgi:hypothetical protein
MIMRKKILFIAPRLPVVQGKGYWDRVVARFADECAVHFLFTQRLEVDTSTVRRLERKGIRVLSLEGMRDETADPEVGAIGTMLLKNEFRAILFYSAATARYFMPFVDEHSPQSISIINATGSKYLLANAGKDNDDCDAEDEFTLFPENGEFLREVAVYSGADLVLVANEGQRQLLRKTIADSTIKVVGDNACSALIDSVPKRHSDAVSLVDTRQVGTRPGQGPFPGAGSGSRIAEYNNALRQIRKDYGLIIAGTNVLADNALEAMVACIRVHPSIGFASPAFLFQAEGMEPALMEKFYRKNVSSRYRDWVDIRGLASTCFLVKRQLVEQIGLLDERFLTLECALFDYYLKAFQVGCRSIRLNDIIVFSLCPEREVLDGYPHQDRILLYDKWGEQGSYFLDRFGCI